MLFTFSQPFLFRSEEIDESVFLPILAFTPFQMQAPCSMVYNGRTSDQHKLPMSLKPKHRVGGRIALDITGYHDDFSGSAKSDIYATSTKKERLYQHIRWKQIFSLYIVACLLIHYFEIIKPYHTFQSCLWNNWETWSESATPHHSIILGDPQIVDEYSYPTRGRLLLHITKLISDNYLHRNHNMYNKVLQPDSVIFVGDLFDGGREWNDTQWLKEYKRFNKIFNPLDGVRQLRQIPGNHDVGFGNGIDFEKYSRFKAYFGNADEVVLLGNHSIILMDTVSLSCKDDSRVKQSSEEFLSKFEDSSSPYFQYPRIAFSHVPLFRFNELQHCGPFRESKKKFPVVKGTQYQTVLEYEMSQRIINSIKPAILFSGDDHDYCHIRHPIGKSYSKNPSDYEYHAGDHPGISYADEVTVKSSAMTGGIQKPAIQLLSLWNPLDKVEDSWKVDNKESLSVDSETAVTHLCYLPSPYKPLVHYGIFIAVSIIWIFICTVKIDYGRRLNLVCQKYLDKLKRTIERLFVKDIKSVDMSHLNRKKSTKFGSIVNFVLIEWNIEHERNWKTFSVNSSLIALLFIITLLWYMCV